MRLLPGFGILTRLKHWRNEARYVDFFATVYWNFRLFPFSIARRLPIFIGHHVDIVNYEKGSIRLSDPNPQRGIVELGITRYPTFPVKGLHTLLRFQGGGKVTFGRDVRIGAGCSFIATAGGSIEFGNDVFINMHGLIYSNASVTIGNHVSIGWYNQIYDSSVHFMVDVHTGEVKDSKKSIIISDNVWVANHVTIAPGAVIPPFTTVAAMSLVNKDFSEFDTPGGFLVGSPAQYKNIGKVRILNEDLEWRIKTHFLNTNGGGGGMCLTMCLLDLNQTPFDADNNALYRTR